MLARKLYRQLLEWKKQSLKKALCISGARQTGKTTIVRHFGREQYKSFVEINFLTDPLAKEIFNGSLQPSTLIANLTAYLRQPLEPKNTLVFFDEIQECPQARVAIKFLVEDGRFDYIESGSLLGVSTKAVASLPVGFEKQLTMYPMDFEEFCWANGVQEQTIELLRTSFENRQPVTPLIHETFKKLFYSYLVVGGMPEAVNLFVNTHDIAKVIDFQREILSLYRQDIIKYSSGQADKIHRIFDEIPAQLDEKNRRFKLAKLDKSARQLRYENSFLWLNDAGVALPCYNVSQLTIPLKLNEKRNLFKLFLCDTGLLTASCAQNTQFALLQGDVSINWGSILENVIAQQLRANGFSLYYFNSVRHGEVDFVVEKNGAVLPIEVKSGKSFRQHSALDNVLSVGEWKLSKAIVLCSENVQETEKIIYLPWYMAMFLEADQTPQTWIHQVDLSALAST